MFQTGYKSRACMFVFKGLKHDGLTEELKDEDFGMYLVVLSYTFNIEKLGQRLLDIFYTTM